jgi:hypothetical protein
MKPVRKTAMATYGRMFVMRPVNPTVDKPAGRAASIKTTIRDMPIFLLVVNATPIE